MMRARHAYVVGLLLTLLAWGCGGTWYKNNRREFTKEEQRLADADFECKDAGSDWECEPPTQLKLPGPVGEITVHPKLTHTTPDAPFKLSARLIASDGRSIPESQEVGRADAPMVEWTLGDGLTQVDQSHYGHVIVVTAAPKAGTAETTQVGVTAKLADNSARLGKKDLEPGSATILVVSAAVAQVWTGDQLWDRFETGAEPNVGLVTGLPAAGAGQVCVHDLVAAYTTIGVIENLAGDCDNEGPVAGAAFLSPNQRFRHVDSPWQAKPDTMTRTGASTTPQPSAPDPVYSIPLRVWRAVTRAAGLTDEDSIDVSFADVMNRASSHTEIASNLLQGNRVGLAAHMADSVDVDADWATDGSVYLRLPAPDGSPDSVRATSAGYCRYIAHLAASLDPGIVPLQYQPLEVVFMSSLFAKGYACPDHDVILLRWPRVAPTTLAHEVGHHLGLRSSVGHTNKLGFTAHNIMWTGESDETYDPRDHVAVGQAYWMNRRAGSYADLLPGAKTVDCGADPRGNAECPCIGVDIDKACEVP